MNFLKIFKAVLFTTFIFLLLLYDHCIHGQGAGLTDLVSGLVGGGGDGAPTTANNKKPTATGPKKPPANKKPTGKRPPPAAKKPGGAAAKKPDAAGVAESPAKPGAASPKKPPPQKAPNNRRPGAAKATTKKPGAGVPNSPSQETADTPDTPEEPPGPQLPTTKRPAAGGDGRRPTPGKKPTPTKPPGGGGKPAPGVGGGKTPPLPAGTDSTGLLSAFLAQVGSGKVKCEEAPESLKSTVPDFAKQCAAAAKNVNSSSKCHYLGTAPTPLAVATATTAATRSSEIVAGTVPWHVLLMSTRTGQFCSAMAVNNKWLLTAAHCLNGDAAVPVRDAWVAIPSLSEFTAAGAPDKSLLNSSVAVVSALVHDKFSYTGDFTSDLALLKLEKPLQNIVPACIADAVVDDKTLAARKCVVYGWEKSANGNTRSLRILVTTPKLNTACTKLIGAVYGDGVFDGARSVCVDAPQDKLVKNYCIGTAGTGLLCNSGDKGTWTLEGIFAYGNMCMGKEYPGVFAKLAAFKQWIQSNIEK